jgi:hypothetical protein
VPNSDTTPVAYYLHDGRVEIKGRACQVDTFGRPETCLNGINFPDDQTIFMLHVGFRPAHPVVFRAPSGPYGNEQATVCVQASTGNVVARWFSQDGVWLDGISFRLDN